MPSYYQEALKQLNEHTDRILHETKNMPTETTDQRIAKMSRFVREMAKTKYKPEK